MIDLPPPAAEIVVTGAGLPAPPGDAAYDVVTIDRARLTGVASGRLEDVLRDVAGFAQYRRSDSRSAHPTSQGATLRGLGGNASSRALVVLDGVPQIDPFGGWVSFAAYDPERLGRVRVTRGGGSGVYGSGALGGTIELESALPSELAGVRGRAAYGSRDAVDAGAGLAGRLGAGFGSVAMAYARGDGFVPVTAATRGPVDRPARYAQASLALRGVVPIGPDTELQASGLGFLDERTRGLAFTGNRNLGADASIRLVGRGRWGWEALTYLQLRAFRSDFASVNAARTTVTQSLDQYEVPATGVGGRIELRPPMGRDVILRLGADVRRVAGATKELFTFVAAAPPRIREAGGREVTAGAFAELTATPSPAITITGGGRVDRWRIGQGRLIERMLATGASLADARFASRTGWEPTGRLGLAVRPAEPVTLRTAGYLGGRLPTLNELSRPFRAGADATAGNAALSPERVRGVDAGVDLRPLPGVRLSATAYWNRLDDAIANVTLGAGPGSFPVVGFVGAGGAYRMRQNLDAVRARGVEVDAALALGRWSLAASYAFVDARVSARGAAATLDGLEPAQTARHQASATLGWARARLGLAATLRYVGPQYEDDQNARRLRDAVTADVTATLPLTPALTIEARGENMFDATVQAGVAGAGAIERATPRTVWLGVRFAG
ncbi:MAG: TonB-dependent receptor [Sphingomonas sp.]